MEYTEFTGKSTEDALKKASDQLGLPLDRLEVEVVSSGSSGLFSLFGGKKAKVRVRPIEMTTEDEVAKMMEEFSSGDQKTAAKSEAAKAEKQKAAAPPKQNRQKPKPADTKDHSNVISTKPERPSQESPEEKTKNGKPEAGSRNGQESVRQPEDDSVVKVAQEVLSKLLAPLDSDAQVSVDNTENSIRLDISGGEPGILIGRRGQTLEALQYITTRIVSHQEGRPVKITVDAGGYRKRRRDNMTDLAHKMASKARHTRKPVAVGPLTAQDRRIIHLALRNEGGVSTISRGRGELKKVIISPRNYS